MPDLRSVPDEPCHSTRKPPADALGLSTAHIAPPLFDLREEGLERLASCLRQAAAKRAFREGEGSRQAAHRPPSLTSARGGAYSDLSPGGAPGRAVGGGKRAEITEFSKASRRRLMRLLNSVDRDRAALPYFVTLTYHRNWPKDRGGRKRHLDAFRKRLERKLGRFPAVWRLEFQKRGAPHYHLLLFLEPGQVAREFGQGRRELRREALSRLRCAVSWLWHEVAEPDSPEHFVAGTQVQEVRSWRGVNAYAAKYMAKLEKLDPSAAPIGRFWGLWRRDLLPISHQLTTISEEHYYRLRRVFRRYSGMKLRNTREHRRVSCFLGHAAANRLLAYYGYYRN